MHHFNTPHSGWDDMDHMDHTEPDLSDRLFALGSAWAEFMNASARMQSFALQSRESHCRGRHIPASMRVQNNMELLCFLAPAQRSLKDTVCSVSV